MRFTFLNMIEPQATRIFIAHCKFFSIIECFNIIEINKENIIPDAYIYALLKSVILESSGLKYVNNPPINSGIDPLYIITAGCTSYEKVIKILCIIFYDKTHIINTKYVRQHK